jgi:thioredoxin-like negative regulator of GroEL
MTPANKKETDPSELMAHKEYAKAIAIYHDRLQQQPEDHVSKISLADALVANNQIDEALKHYGQLAEIYTRGMSSEHIRRLKRCLRPFTSKPDLTGHRISDWRN